jgi:aspartyl/asparaginyl-tRNA synthetase
LLPAALKDSEKRASLAKLIGCQLQALRNKFSSSGFLEILPPHLEPYHPTPFARSLEVNISSNTDPRQGILSIAPDPYLASALTLVDRAYCITSAFRNDRLPTNQLLEFTYVQAWANGTLEEGIALLESLFESVISDVTTQGLVDSDQAESLTGFPGRFERISHSDALVAVGKNEGSYLAYADHLNLTQQFRSNVICVDGFPPDEEPRIFDAVQYSADGKTKIKNFELLAPFCGEVASGREVVTDPDMLLHQFENSRYLSELLRAGFNRDSVSGYAGLLGKLSSPVFCISIGFERFTQYLLGQDLIEDAVLFPVTGDELRQNNEQLDIGIASARA